MNDTNMTLADYLDYASVYEFTQDHYDMERMFMELSLVNMHLESYDFLREAADMTISKLNVLMVESGPNDRSYATEQIFVEKAGGIISGIKKLFSMIGKAIAAFFNKLGSIFSGGSKKSKDTDAATAQILGQANETVKKIDRAVDVATTMQDARDLLEDVVESGKVANEGMHRVLTRVNDLLGGGGVKVLGNGLDTENAPIIPVLIKFNEFAEKIPDFPKFNYNDDKLNVIIAMCSEQYEVEALEFIVDMEKIVDKLNELLDIKGEMGSTDNYNSFWKIIKKYGPEGMFERIENLKKEINAMGRRNKRMTVSAEILVKKRDTAVKLSELFQKLADTSDIGPQDSNNVLDIVRDKFIGNDQQYNRLEQVTGDFKIRYDRDKSIYADRGIGPAKKIVQPVAKTLNYNANKNYFVRYLREIYQLAIELQHTTNDAIRLLNDHITIRNETIAAKEKYNDSLVRIINDVTQILNMERQNPTPAPEAPTGSEEPAPEETAGAGGEGGE